MARLRQPDTGLHASADHSLLDLIADSAPEVPDMKVVSRCPFLFVLTAQKLLHIHILSGDLTHKRTLGLLKTVIYGLRRYDEDRRAALLSPAGKEVQEQRREKAKGFM
ncbi:hypothetical protein DFJ58DRAFT_732393 [Suillus subalutaceus]|uniref:uncharacterized protein n=1 Tax=Suillus subalutaceus TaxID=48586 RepID=UPI001B87081F|nr:uncharacterized protein DFJ58DRAFT_732393 [Suillus subalutaceus]KAG1841543.1 hypothetical protein DFJ58DRAFT_732393 [Suillus subalutaceus]